MMKKQFVLRVIDFETSGLSDDQEQCVIEAAYIDICAEQKMAINRFQEYVVPTVPIEIEAQAVHHI